jgi:hypothetical protein
VEGFEKAKRAYLGIWERDGYNTSLLEFKAIVQDKNLQARIKEQLKHIEPPKKPLFMSAGRKPTGDVPLKENMAQAQGFDELAKNLLEKIEGKVNELVVNG